MRPLLPFGLWFIIYVMYQQCHGKPQSCRSNLSGGNYNGDVRMSISGRQCQRWDEQIPHVHNVTSGLLPDVGLQEAENFCRSPDFDPGGPWCFTTDPAVEWEYCQVPVCESKGCRDNGKGTHYIGKVDTTERGSKCRDWSEVKTFTAYGYLPYAKTSFPDGDLEHAYCRNPLGMRERPWCHTTVTGGDAEENDAEENSWEFCDIPLCVRPNTFDQEKVIQEKACQIQGGVCVSRPCCTQNDYVSSFCADDLVCCLSSANCGWHKDALESAQWPHGSYGLPMPIFGCPSNDGFAWLRGQVRLSSMMEPVIGNLTSLFLRVLGPYGSDDLTLNMCIRNGVFEGRTNDWPNGKYCLFQYRDNCPKGFADSSLKVDTRSGLMVEGHDLDVTCGREGIFCFRFCCRDDGDTAKAVTLPTGQAFYLLQHSRECQSVDGMSVTAEHIHLPLTMGQNIQLTEDDNSLPSPMTLVDGGLILGLCFYESIALDSCYDPEDKGFFYRGNVNVTSKGVCSYWNDIVQIDYWKLYDYVGLDDNNYCRNTVVFETEERPWCYVNGEKELCDIPMCETSWSNYALIGKGRPARQTTGGIEQAQLANDGNIGTCSKQMLTKAWWQMDLQGWYDVIAIRIYRSKVELCVVRLANIYVGLRADEHWNNGALMCVRNVSIGASPDGIIRCNQPVRGQYITLENLAYIEYESGKKPYSQCLYICEVVVYVKDSNCGRRLLERSRGNEVQPIMTTSAGEVVEPWDSILHNEGTLCLKQSPGQALWVKLDMLYPCRLQGVSTQGSPHDDSMVTTFTLKYGLTQQNMVTYEEFTGKPKIFRNDPKVEEPQLHDFPTGITARLVLIEVREYYEMPCMRIDLIGCINTYENLVKTAQTEQASVQDGKAPDFAVDLDASTCSQTLLENTTWWKADLSEDVVLHSLVLQTGTLFPWNLAGGRRALQKSMGWSGLASLAVDGKHLVNYWEASCSHTLGEKDPWWAVDFGQAQTVSSVMITNRRDCCEARLNKFKVLIGNEEPVEGQLLNVSHYEVCLEHDKYFNAGETRTLHCKRPLTGRYLLIYITTEEGYLALCEVMVFGNKAPFLVGVSSKPPPGALRKGTACHLATEVPIGGLVHSYSCPVDQKGQFVAAEVPSSAALALCDVVAYGGEAATLTELHQGSSLTEVSCQGTLRLHLEQLTTNSTAQSNALTVNKQNVRSIFHTCEGTKKCNIPLTKDDGLGETQALSFFCSRVTEPSSLCTREFNQEGTIMTPHFPFYYGLDLECYWVIMAPAGRYISLNVTTILLPAQVKTFRDGCLEVNLGDCTDSAVIFNGRGPASYISTLVDGSSVPFKGLNIDRPSLFISDTDTMSVRFTSCYRNVGLEGEWNQKLGMQADITFQACHGCQLQSSATLLECSGQCGHILSRGFPNGYGASDRTLWTITVATGNYITLTFEDFDIYENPLATCLKDYVEVLDVNLFGIRSHFGRYCNSERPPFLLKSSWSQLELLFISDSEINGRGFHAVYRQNKYQLSEEFPEYGPDPACPHNWTHFEGYCYSLVTWHQPLIWLEAETECQQSGGHLVAINSRQEMVFLHYMLTTEWRSKFYTTFIGLNDRETEGWWQWVDGSPVTYTDWSLSSDYGNVQQPDGAAVEDCVMIRLDSVHDTRSWHDIPCAYNNVQQFLCETAAATDITGPNPERELALPEGVVMHVQGLDMCDNGEFILSHLRCNSHMDCHDGSDEFNCVQEGDTSCSQEHFTCSEGACIPMTSYCNFVIDCPDESDEAHCVRRPCTDGEFRCDNGECILEEERCNLITNCQDLSDETNCERCSSEVAFQCFDGGCIPKKKRCDSVVDCPGALHEDEAAECSQEKAEESCLDWKVAGYEENGKYNIHPKDVDGFQVECDMTSQTDFVATKVHHDSERRIYVTGYQKPGDYIHHIDYGLTKDQLKAVTTSSVRCEQYVSIECFAASGMTEHDYWFNIDGQQGNWTSTSDDCHCLLTSSCIDENKECKCSTSETTLPRHLTMDAGDITSLEDLPITALSLSGARFEGSQYQYHYIGPLVCYQYANRSREDFHCRTGQWVTRQEQCVADRDKYGDVTGCRDLSHLQGCDDMMCPPEYIKCAEGHCVPLERVCDGTSDCIGREDEQNCGNFSCPGHLRCEGENICVTLKQRCDGVRQCKAGNDELLCGVTCPEECSCTGLTFRCQDAGLTSIPSLVSKQARKLNFTLNNLTLGNGTFDGYLSLGELILRSNGLSGLPVGVFSPLNNLYYLDLSNNSIEVIRSYTFSGLLNLKVLLLEGNIGLSNIQSLAFAGLDRIKFLGLRGLGIQGIEAEAFGGIPMIKSLDLSQNEIMAFVNVLQGLDSLTHLNVSGNIGLEITRKEFMNVPNLNALQSDHFKYCCFVSEKVHEKDCLPKPDEFSSCEDLMSRSLLKVFLWVLGLMAFLCNMFVLIYRRSERMTVYSFSVMNLAVADFFMGFYMVTLASVDAYYRGVYIEFADVWTNSWICQFLGFINTFSSETSVFTLCLISADRFYKIVFPLQATNFGMKQAKRAMAFIWLIGFSLAALPLMPISYFGDGFYGKSSVCISIYLTQDYSPGWQFSIGIFHGLNFMCFMFIFVAYAYLFHVVKKSSDQTKNFSHGQNPNQNDIALARRLTLVVFTDFLCWVPINSMGLAAGLGATVPGEVYAWVVVFLLPINSAINPLLYTISSIRLKAKQVKEASKASMSSARSTLSVTVHIPDPKKQTTDLKTFLAQYKILPHKLALGISKDLAAILAEVHAKGCSCPSIDTTNITVSGKENDLQFGVDVCTTAPDQTEDMWALGKVISQLLRRMVSTNQ